MNIKNHEGQAFPIAGGIGDLYQPGMLLRDYFAAAAMQGLIACPTCFGSYNDLAVDAYKYAEALMAERAKTKGEQS